MKQHSHTISIAGREIGSQFPPYVVAEMSGNHNGDINRAFAIMEAAKDAGADAIKLQTYTAETITIDCDGPGFQISEGLWKGRTLFELYGEAHTPWEWHEALFAKGKELGITVFSSPFDPTSIELLESLDAPAYKIASFEIVDIPLIEKAAATGKPLIISTGMASQQEAHDAVMAARKAGNGGVILLHCTSGYPTPVQDANLVTMSQLAEDFEVAVGLSDHTYGTVVSVAATALGACFIEKHFTLSRADGGPDADFSLEPAELLALTTDCRAAWLARGEVNYGAAGSEKGSVEFRRSLYAVKDIAAGEVFTETNTRSIRPGYGLKPVHLYEIIGSKAVVDIKRGTPMQWSLIEETSPNT
jgi:pseudaminic acid synthase